MSHNVTTKQAKTIHLLASGLSATEVARRLKLRRETISRWRKNIHFNLEFDRVMSEVRQNLNHRLLALVERSISAVNQGVDDEQDDAKRLKTALTVLKIVGIER